MAVLWRLLAILIIFFINHPSPSYGAVLKFERSKVFEDIFKVSPGRLLPGNKKRPLEDWIQEIQGYRAIADQIIERSVHGPAANQSYNRLATFVDKFGNRQVGSQNLEDSIDYMLDKLKEDGLKNVHGEEVWVPRWVRGQESAEMLSPRRKDLALLGLGTSVGTPENGIQSEVIVVRSWADLDQHAKQVKGKIVVYNQEWISYSVSVDYRSNGAARAAVYGAVATLIRSVTPLSIYSPHTGMQDYADGVKKIPTACITVEDAEMMDRMQQRGEKIVVKLMMGARNLPPVKSRNTVAEVVGSTYPDEVVLVSGHLDSWDVGQGAMDDGGGAFISWQALSLISQLGLQPKRTMRMVMWTGEEIGAVGAEAYFQAHKENIGKFDMVMESDIGTFLPYGIQFTGNEEATKIMKSVLDLLQPINATKLKPGADGEDIDMWMSHGVPGSSLYLDTSKYFYYHHTNGDTMTVQNPGEMNLCAAVWAVVAFTVADMEEMLPR
ncbi:carboxypeptidase Q-like [Mizuhopecten yessoensis]|uniref:Carboxypeptidase Q n=1 Tax=Mizuhopecten yessoensis TaxID=6573 RepID=A0A210Q9W8_MIZYE|nr:carboxypeptidase Q-like [Mizuhopecten yessoensis]XP_021363653.1 carboxypeptidase Q-like [Mizuhopecten yessoensis]OWF45518.1 Carboxypeptidase Q [Mizuhopecten yessoensis]